MPPLREAPQRIYFAKRVAAATATKCWHGETQNYTITHRPSIEPRRSRVAAATPRRWRRCCHRHGTPAPGSMAQLRADAAARPLLAWRVPPRRMLSASLIAATMLSFRDAAAPPHADATPARYFHAMPRLLYAPLCHYAPMPTASPISLRTPDTRAVQRAAKRQAMLEAGVEKRHDTRSDAVCVLERCICVPYLRARRGVRRVFDTPLTPPLLLCYAFAACVRAAIRMPMPMDERCCCADTSVRQPKMRRQRVRAMLRASLLITRCLDAPFYQRHAMPPTALRH